MFLKLLLTITCVQLCYGAVILGNLHDGLENENQQNLYNRYTKFLNYIQHEKEPSFGIKVVHLCMIPYFTLDEVKENILTIRNVWTEERNESEWASLRNTFESRISAKQAERIETNMRQYVQGRTLDEREKGLQALLNDAFLNVLNYGIDLFVNQYVTPSNEVFNAGDISLLRFDDDDNELDNRVLDDSYYEWVDEDTKAILDDFLKSPNIDDGLVYELTAIFFRFSNYFALFEDEIDFHVKLFFLSTAPKFSLNNLRKVFESMKDISNINDCELTLLKFILKKKMTSSQTESILQSLQKMRSTSTMDEQKYGKRQLMKFGILNALDVALKLVFDPLLIDTTGSRKEEITTEGMSNSIHFHSHSNEINLNY